MANLTRIQNNQIYDSTIQAQQKIASGSITGNLLATNLTLNSNVTILGNLQVANSYTQLNSVNTYINDPIVVFNNGYVGSVAGYDIGILINRNGENLPGYGGVNAFLGWSENEQAFIAIATTESGTGVSAINNSGYANLRIGRLSANAASITGGLTAGSLTNTPISGSTGSFTYLTATTGLSTANAVITGGYIGYVANITTDLGNITTLNTTTGNITTLTVDSLTASSFELTGMVGNANVAMYKYIQSSTTNGTFYLGFYDKTAGNAAAFVNSSLTYNPSSGKLSATTLDGTNGSFTTTVTTNFSTGNARITGGYADNFAIGANTAATGAFTTLATSANINLGGDIVPSTDLVYSLGDSTHRFKSLYVGGNTIYVGTATISVNNDGNLALTTTGGGIFNVAASTSANNIFNANVQAPWFLGAVDAVTVNAATLNSNKATLATAVATNFSTGNALVTGGNVNGLTTLAAGNAVVTNFSTGNALVTGGDVNGLTTLAATTAVVTNFSSGNIQASSVLATSLIGTNFSSGNAVITGGSANGLTTLQATTAQATNFSSGNVNITGGSITGVTVTNISDLTITNFQSGNARITGGYADNFPIGANTASTGKFTSVTATNLQPTRLVLAGNGGVLTDNVDLTYNAFGQLSTSQLIVNSYAEFRNNLKVTQLTTGRVTFAGNDQVLTDDADFTFNGTTLTVTDIVSGTATVGGLQAKAIGNVTPGTGAFTTLTSSGATTFTSSATSYSTGTGAVVVTGGVGIGGNLNVGGRADIAGNVYISGNLQVTGQSVSIGASSLVVKDPVINLHTPDDFSEWTYNDLADIGVIMHHYDTADSHAFFGRMNNSGFFEYWAKGEDLANVFSGTTYGTIKAGEFKAANTTPSTSTTTGALTVAGGAGIAGDLYAANLSVGTGNVTVGNVNATKIYGDFYGTVINGSGFAQAANVSLYQSLTNSGLDDEFYIPFYDKATGNAQAFTNTSFYANPNSGNLYAGTFNGSAAGLTGTAWQLTAGFADYATEANYASTSGAAVQAEYVGVTANGSNSTFYLTFASNSTTDYYSLGSDSELSYNPSTNTLTTEVLSYGGANGTYLKATNFLTANAVITGGQIQVGTLQANNFSTANAVITGGQVQVDTLQANNFSTANAAISGGNSSFGTLSATNFSTANAVITGGQVQVDTLQANNFSTANAVITGGNSSFGTLSATNFSTANAAISGGNSSFGTLSATNFSTANAAISGGDVNGLTTLAANTAVATNFSSGNAKITGGDASGLTTLSATTAVITNFSSGNAVVTGGSLNNVAIGETTASTGKFTTVIATGNIVAASATASTNTTTGALVVKGGAGVSGDVNVGGSVATVGVTSTGNIAINTATDSGLTTTQATAYLFNEVASTVKLGAAATTINIGNTSGKVIVAGVTESLGNIVAASTTDSTTSTTGALVVKGGMGVAANVTVDGGMLINQAQQNARSFIAKGVNDSTLLWARPNSTYDQVVIGNSATAGTLVQGAKLIINSTDSILLPVGTSSQRPSNSGGTDTTGMLRYSTTRGTVEFYDGASWQSTTSTFTIIVEQQFTGTGSQTEFTLSQAATTASVIVSINGVIQIGGAGYAYTVSGTTLTFSEAPQGTDIVDVRILTTTQTIRGIASDNGYNGIRTDNNGVYLTAGAGGSVTIRRWLNNGAEVNSTTGVTALTTTTIDTFDSTVYSSAEYVVTVTDGSGLRTISRFLLAADNANAAFLSAITTIDSSGGTTIPGTYSVTNASGTASLKFTPTTGSYSVRVKATYQLA